MKYEALKLQYTPSISNRAVRFEIVSFLALLGNTIFINISCVFSLWAPAYIFIWHYLFCMDNVTFSLSSSCQLTWRKQREGEKRKSSNKERVISCIRNTFRHRHPKRTKRWRERTRGICYRINGITWILFSVAFLWRIMVHKKCWAGMCVYACVTSRR